MTENKKSSGKVTIYDVARVAGVSYGTVSRVINNSDKVRPDTHKRVMDAMMQLGFSVNQQARHLAGKRSHMIGMILSHIESAYDGAVIRGVLSTLSDISYELLLYSTIYRKTREAAYMATLTRGLADGFLLLIPENTHMYVDVLLKQHVPYVLIDYRSVDVPGPSIRATNREGAYEATTHLIKLGHRRIGFITGTSGWGCVIERMEGYKAALKDHGLPVDPQLIQEGNFRHSQGSLCAETLLELAKPPTAIFASNDASAFGAIEAAQIKGLRVPEDISVIGFDDTLQAEQTRPGLTTVRQPLEQMGQAAVRLLMDYIEHPDLPTQTITLPTTLILRGTTQAPM